MPNPLTVITPEHPGSPRSMGYGCGQLAGRYLLTACDGYRCDYYEAWLEIWDNG
uniref:hypothetical protein n=1 Tax=Enterocloster clostridioformis TaxID=1531 RepID=UPI0026EC92D2|nr:hypothetical protein [Enterocloster clostridioformis]